MKDKDLTQDPYSTIKKELYNGENENRTLRVMVLYGILSSRNIENSCFIYFVYRMVLGNSYKYTF